MDADEYRKRGREMVDYIAEYLETVKDRHVFPDVQPGYIKNLIPEKPPSEGEIWEDIFKDVERVIMPGMTHWQSPHMHAYFPSLNSYPALLGDMLANAIGCLGFTWAASPACTELEVIVMDWLGEMIGLPPCFLHKTEGVHSGGGGVNQGTASESTLLAMLSARSEVIRRTKERDNLLEEATIMSRLVAYASDQAHSSVEKACLISKVKYRTLPSDERLCLGGDVLEAAIKEDKENGLIPFYLCATLGTTGACAFDKLNELGPICKKEEIWMHVDAAYAATSFICPEYREYLDGVEYSDSFSFNPSKWMMVTFDCNAFWVKSIASLQQLFNVNPLYLKHENPGAIDFMHLQIPLSRRFRSLKLWFVIRNFGIKGLQEHVRKGVKLAKLFEEQVKKDANFEIPAKRLLGLVVFRLKGCNGKTEKLLKLLNNTRKIHMVPAQLKDKFVIRFVVTSQNTTEQDILDDWYLIQETARQLINLGSNWNVMETVMEPIIIQNGHGHQFSEENGDQSDILNGESLVHKERLANKRKQLKSRKAVSWSSIYPTKKIDGDSEADLLSAYSIAKVVQVCPHFKRPAGSDGNEIPAKYTLEVEKFLAKAFCSQCKLGNLENKEVNEDDESNKEVNGESSPWAATLIFGLPK